MTHPFYTIGHSTRPVEAFVELLTTVGITFVADVRTVPRSRTNPQFNRDVLPDALAAAQIEYEHIPTLGGLRGRQPDVLPSTNAFWQNESFHNYADYAMGGAFRSGLAQLLERGQLRVCAIMCAEAVWWQCHRRIIADYLLAAGETVFHILGPGKIEPARMTDAARWHSSAVLTYPVRNQSINGSLQGYLGDRPGSVVKATLRGFVLRDLLSAATEAMVAELPKKKEPMPAMPPGGGMDY